MLQFGMPTLIEKRTLEENISLCRSLGLQFIELNMNFPEYQTDRLEAVDSLLSAAEQAGIYYTVHLDENLDIADLTGWSRMPIWRQYAGLLKQPESFCACVTGSETDRSR